MNPRMNTLKTAHGTPGSHGVAGSRRFFRVIRVFRGLILTVLAAAASAATPPLTTAEGFAVPQPGHRFVFPRDHGSHPDFKIEWWYVTGHLYAASAVSGTPPRRFGFQATFFRQAGPRLPAGAAPSATSSTDPNPNFGTGHLFLAHMALVDVQSGRFLHQERLNREGWDAAAATDTLDVRNGTWSLCLADPADASASPTLQLSGGIQADATFTLTLRAAKPLVVFGENSLSRKGSDPTAASYYLTFTRLAVDGNLTLHGERADETLRVTGEAWMDHEISSSQLSSGQVGWDWLSVQFADRRELMLYRLRLRDGSADPASTLTWTDAAGRTQRMPFTWEVLTRWTSPATGATYPARIRIATTDPATGQPVAFTAEPLVAAQELPGTLGGVPYWEGACRIRDASGNEVGSAYMELTGYAKDLKL
jgi:predicted secreted hydrolase